MKAPDPNSQIITLCDIEDVNPRARRAMREYFTAGTVGNYPRSHHSLWRDIQRRFIRLRPSWGEEMIGPEVDVPHVDRTCRYYRADYGAVRGKNTWMATRDVSIDADIVRQCGKPSLYALMDAKGKKVLDLGAHIGGYSILAAQQGAVHVLAIEPDPESAAMLRFNTKDYPTVFSIQTAAVGENNPDEVYLSSPEVNTAGASIRFARQEAPSIRVRTMSIKDIYAFFQPDVMKVDVEGCEYELLMGDVPIPDSVRQIAVEFSFGGEWTAKAHALIDLFKDWTCLKQPNPNASMISEGVWRR